MTSTIIENIKMRSIKGKSKLVWINFKKDSIYGTTCQTISFSQGDFKRGTWQRFYRTISRVKTKQNIGLFLGRYRNKLEGCFQSQPKRSIEVFGNDDRIQKTWHKWFWKYRKRKRKKISKWVYSWNIAKSIAFYIC